MVTEIRLCVTKEKPSKTGEVRKRPWRVDIPASLAGERRRRLRKFFLTKREAENFVSDFLSGSMRGGVDEALGGQTVGEALTDYLDAKMAGAGQRQKETLKHHGGRIRAKFGPVKLAALTVSDVERFVSRPEWSKRTQWNALSYLRAFLNWCQRRELISKNPAERLAEEWQKPESPREILSIDEMKILLDLTKQDPVMRAFVVLGGFAGLRSSELMRIDWKDVNRGEREVHVRPGVIKKTRGVRERFTTINATCLRWLPKAGEGSVIPYTQRAFGRRTEKLIAQVKSEMEKHKISGSERWHDWPQNCLRHSFASYLLAVKEDAGYVAYQMGHTSADMVYQTYARAVRKVDAVAWWAI